ncbi:MAG: 16S rRNA (cytosine(1402)-N(4))-methyltransferase RsmH [Muribaculaceae bacterium]|nr:16S rRNA (cytosine(1402)-N(4))-methyltransferase RsmH [Muribaculaceae bacterium]
MENIVYHIPALLEESIAALNIQPSGTYADATFGGGGHSRAILSCLGPSGRLFGFDRDADARQNVPDDTRFTFVYSNFRFMRNFMRFYGIEDFNGILADLGVSFHHFDDENRGFSFRSDSPLDMRMNQSQQTTAGILLNELSDKEITNLLKLYTDLKRPALIAQRIVKARENQTIDTTGQLTEILQPVLNPKNLKKELAQVFQAIRIEVNGEMDALKSFLKSTPSMLKPGGRLAILTYHSIEDRIVKNFMKTGSVNGEEEKDFFGKSLSPWKMITRSPITPTENEIERNPRARSAKLRVAEYIGPNH